MKYILSILALSALSASTALAQVTGPSYDFDKLQALWAPIAAPDSQWYSDLKTVSLWTQAVPQPAPTPVATPVPSPTPTPKTKSKTRETLPDLGGATDTNGTGGTSAGGSATTPAPEPTASFKFPVLAPIGNLAGDLYAKSARIEMYLAAEQFFSGLTMTPQEEQGLTTTQKDEIRLQRFRLVKQRALSANLELYLMKLSRYFEANRLSDKCNEMRAADQIYANALTKIKNPAADLLPAWVTLYADFKTLIDTTQADSQRFASCNLGEVNSKGETINRIRDIVGTAVAYRLRDRIAKEIAFFDSQTSVSNCGASNLSDLQKLSCMGDRLSHVQFPLDETFELARQVRDVKANLDLVSFGYQSVRDIQSDLRKKAGMDIQGQLLPGYTQFFPKLGAVVSKNKDPNATGNDLAAGSVLKDESILALDKGVQDATQNIIDGLKLMGDLQLKFGANETKVCANLSQRFKDLNFGDETVKGAFIADVRTCARNMTTVVNSRLNASDNDRFQSTFVTDLGSISKIMLDNLKSLDSSDNGGGFDNF